MIDQPDDQQAASAPTRSASHPAGQTTSIQATMLTAKA